jgi:serine phosphatase RsbU (regulator of sigma subunit)
MSSIRYAQRIQSAILPPQEDIAPLFRDHFIFFRPRDIVSGDLYWFASVKRSKAETESAATEPDTIPRSIDQEPEPQAAERSLIAAVDCTGHGVPGAFLSILGHDILNRTLKEPSVNSPSEALNFLDAEVQKTFARSQGEAGEVKDGMDMALCEIDRERMELRFAGAKNPCYVVRAGELYELKGNKKAIGEKQGERGEAWFTERWFELQEGDCIYIFSDGYVDQFGGPKGKKFKLRPFKELLCRVQNLPMGEQHRIIEESFDDWKQDHEQVDDVLVLGVRI